jgi:LIM domain kinase 2
VTHRDTNEVMVVKQLHSDSTIDQEAYSNFLKEVKVLRTSQHHNVLRFIGVLYRDGELNLVTEFIESGTLKELINKVTPEGKTLS